MQALSRRCLHTHAVIRPISAPSAPRASRSRRERSQVAAVPEDQQRPSDSDREASSSQPGTPWRGDLTFEQFKQQYLQPEVALPGSFALGTLTFGLKTSTENFSLTEDPLGFVGCAIVCGCIVMAMAWVLLDFTDAPPPRR